MARCLCLAAGMACCECGQWRSSLQGWRCTLSRFVCGGVWGCCGLWMCGGSVGDYGCAVGCGQALPGPLFVPVVSHPVPHVSQRVPMYDTNQLCFAMYVGSKGGSHPGLCHLCQQQDSRPRLQRWHSLSALLWVTWGYEKRGGDCGGAC